VVALTKSEEKMRLEVTELKYEKEMLLERVKTMLPDETPLEALNEESAKLKKLLSTFSTSNSATAEAIKAFMADDTAAKDMKQLALRSIRITRALIAETQELKVQLGEIDEAAPSYSHDAEYFLAFGNAPSVPRCLRFAGRIRNRQMTRRQTSQLVSEIFMKKRQHDLEQAERSVLIDYMHVYFFSMVGLQPMVAEMSYNLLAAVDKYYFDPDMRIFHHVMMGEGVEDLWWSSVDIISKFQQTLDKWDRKANGGKQTGKVSRTAVMQALSQLFETKPRSSVLKVGRALRKDQPGKYIDIKRLFEETREGQQSMVIETLRNQHVDEWHEYTQEIEQALLSASSNGTATGSISVLHVKKTLAATDPNKPAASVLEYVQRAFDLSPETDISTILHLEVAAPPSQTIPPPRHAHTHT
jgi:hypothetical protein